MKIRKVYIKNLFSYKEFEIKFDRNFNIIVGPNNAGKTNIFRVIQFIMDIIDNKLKAKDIRGYLHDPSKEEAKIKIWVELDESEKRTIHEFFEGYFDKYLYELDSGIAQGKFKINDVLPTYNGPEGHYDRPTLNWKTNELLSESIKHFVNTLPEFLSAGVFIWNYSGEYPHTPEVNFLQRVILNQKLSIHLSLL
ncbi:MAG: AAA family ATPase [Candidatus Heimdallarchaeaceae archaeon]